MNAANICHITSIDVSFHWYNFYTRSFRVLVLCICELSILLCICWLCTKALLAELTTTTTSVSTTSAVSTTSTTTTTTTTAYEQMMIAQFKVQFKAKIKDRMDTASAGKRTTRNTNYIYIYDIQTNIGNKVYSVRMFFNLTLFSLCQCEFRAVSISVRLLNFATLSSPGWWKATRQRSDVMAHHPPCWSVCWLDSLHPVVDSHGIEVLRAVPYLYSQALFESAISRTCVRFDEHFLIGRWFVNIAQLQHLEFSERDHKGSAWLLLEGLDERYFARHPGRSIRLFGRDFHNPTQDAAECDGMQSHK